MDLQKVINNLKQLADYCDKVTSGNVSHKIAHLKYAIINIVESLESSSHKDKEMTLDEAIQHAQEVANKGCDQCAKDHQQLADWLKELKELRERGWHPASEKSKIKIGETILVLFKSPIRGRLLPWADTYNGELPFNANWWIRFPKEE